MPSAASSCEIELFEDDEHGGAVRWWRKYGDDGDFVATVALCDHHHDAQESDLGADLRPEPKAAPSSGSDRYAEIARACVRELIRRLEFNQACDLCDAGQPDDDGGDKEHDEECPFHGYDHTKDVEPLKAWAAPFTRDPPQVKP